ncbi:MAG: hypothetical protein IJT03_08925 [Clostridia bacterium]|nr:hypothetical protein [Clostridia bacterium]
MKKLLKPQTIIGALEFALLALILAEAYLNNKEKVDSSVANLLNNLKSKGEVIDEQ